MVGIQKRANENASNAETKSKEAESSSDRAAKAAKIAEKAIGELNQKLKDADISTEQIKTLAKQQEQLREMIASQLIADPVFSEELFRASAPIGTIIAWHKSLEGIPDKLPLGWVECNGDRWAEGLSPNQLRYLDGSESILSAIPELNGERRFLRGDHNSGIPEDEAIRRHHHDKPEGSFLVEAAASDSQIRLKPQNSGNGWFGAKRWHRTGPSSGDGKETRPINMSVIWIIRVK